MELREYQKRVWWTWALVGMLVVIFSSLMTSACGKSDKKTPVAKTPGNPGVGSTCITSSCVATTNRVAYGYGYTQTPYEQLQIGLHLYAAQPAPTPVATPVTGGPVPQYAGAVLARGYISVQGGMAPDCPIPPGMYAIRTPAPSGTFNRFNTFDVSNLQIEALRSGGPLLRIQVSYGEFFDTTPVIGADGYSYSNGFFGQMAVVSVDGFMCGFAGMPTVWTFPKF